MDENLQCTIPFRIGSAVQEVAGRAKTFGESVEKMSRIKSKAEFYARWHAGFLGNHPRVWDTYEQLSLSPYRGPVVIRSVGEAGGPVLYNVPFQDVYSVLAGWRGAATMNEVMPDDRLRLQGEVTRSWRGLELTYSCTPGLKMRDAMRSAKTAVRVEARAILDAFLAYGDKKQLEGLMEWYPEAVIEFGIYDCTVGELANSHLIIWEVRNY